METGVNVTASPASDSRFETWRPLRRRSP